jgi:hypothetical protein
MDKELTTFLKTEFCAVAHLLDKTGHQLAQEVLDACPDPMPELEFPTMLELGLLRHGGKLQLAQACGYRNLSKGCRRLDSWIEGTSLPDRNQLEDIAAALAVTPDQMEKSWDNDKSTRKFAIAKKRAMDPTYGLVVRLMAAVYSPQTLPAEMTLAEALGHAGALFTKGRDNLSRCLVLPNGLAIYITGSGKLGRYGTRGPRGGLVLPLLPIRNP